MSGAEFSARNSPVRVALLVLLSIGFVILGAWIAGMFGEPPKPGAGWIGWFSIVFFGACGVAGLRRLFDRSEMVRISDDGVYYRSWSDATIPWSEIVDVTVWEHKGQRMIVLHLAHPDLFPSTSALRGLAGLSRGLTGGDIAITLTGTDRSFAEAMEAMFRFGDPQGD